MNTTTPASADRMLRKKAWNYFKIILAILLIAYVFSRTDVQELVQVWTTLSHPWLLASIGCFILMLVVKTFQYRVLIDPKLSYWNVLNIIIMQNAISNFISNAAGVVSYVSMFRAEHGVKISRSTIAFIIVKAGDLTAILLLLVSSLLFVWPVVVPLHALLLLLSIGIFSSLVVFFATIFYRHGFMAFLRKILIRLKLSRFPLVQRMLTLLESLSGQEPAVINSMLLKAILYSGLYFALTISWSYTIIQAFQIPIDFPGIVFVSALRQIISFIPIQVFGGLGVNEITSLYLFSLFGVPVPALSAALLGIRIYNTVLNGLTLLYIPFGRSRS